MLNVLIVILVMGLVCRADNPVSIHLKDMKENEHSENVQVKIEAKNWSSFQSAS